jgi:hypothetical protein
MKWSRRTAEWQTAMEAIAEFIADFRAQEIKRSHRLTGLYSLGREAKRNNSITP